MRYYIVDNQGNVHGDSDTRKGAEVMLSDTITFLGNEEAERLELEIIEGE